MVGEILHRYGMEITHSQAGPWYPAERRTAPSRLQEKSEWNTAASSCWRHTDVRGLVSIIRWPAWFIFFLWTVHPFPSHINPGGPWGAQLGQHIHVKKVRFSEIVCFANSSRARHSNRDFGLPGQVSCLKHYLPVNIWENSCMKCVAIRENFHILTWMVFFIGRGRGTDFGRVRIKN